MPPESRTIRRLVVKVGTSVLTDGAGRMLPGRLEHVADREGVLVFHAGTKKDRDRCVTWGGRVLNVVGRGHDLEDALKRAYEAIGMIHYEGEVYRKDIGFRALKKPAVTP